MGGYIEVYRDDGESHGQEQLLFEVLRFRTWFVGFG